MSNIQIREITEDEHRAKTRQDREEWRKVLQLAQGGKILSLTCADYREARTMAQRLTAVRSFYSFNMRIQHRGKEIFIRLCVEPVEISVITPDEAPKAKP